MNRNRIWSIPARILLTVAVIALGFTACSDMGSDEPLAPQQKQPLTLYDADNPGIQRAMEVQDRHTSALMRLDEDIVGTATSVDENGTPVVLVLTKNGTARDLPTVLEGVPVKSRVVGEIVAYDQTITSLGKGGKPSGGGGGKPGGGGANPTKRQSRPVPIGVSTGNIIECNAGTIGCRVRFPNGDVGALSTNSVFARINQAQIGEDLVQPGREHNRCKTESGDIFATLSAFRPVDFTGASNIMDAAIALSSTANLGNATPTGGYGLPSSTTVLPAKYMEVQKYGCSRLTTAMIFAINGTTTVGYGAGRTALFTNQIFMTPGSFRQPGDNGSLVVTNDANANPVGILFAGGPDACVANPIDPILAYFGVVIDGK